MKYSVVYLWVSCFKRITELLSMFKNGFKLEFAKNCQLKVINYIDSFCHREVDVLVGNIYNVTSSTDYTINIKGSLSYLIVNGDNKRHMIIFYHLPSHLIDMPVDYHRWKWNETKNPGLILMPNLKNNPKYYLRLNFKKFCVVDEKQIKYQLLDDSQKNYLHPDLSFKFYLDSHLPITIYDSHGDVILGENLDTDQYIEKSPELDLNQNYCVS